MAQIIEYIGIIGFLPRRGDDQERLIDTFKLNFDYSGSCDPDVVAEPTIFFRLDDEIYQFRVQEVMIEFNGKWYLSGDRSSGINKFTENDLDSVNAAIDEMRLSMYGGTEKVLVQVREELGL